MNVEIFNKSNGSAQTFTNNIVTIENPSIVRLRIARAEVTSMLREGNDMLVTLSNGETVRLVNFYSAGGEENATPNDLVLQEADGSAWLAGESKDSPFKQLTSWDQFLSSSLASVDSSGGGGFVLPILGLAGAAGIAAAAGGGGGCGGGGNTPPPPPTTTNPPPSDTTPPIAPTARLVVDSGVSATDNITNDGRVQATGVETGATLQYQINGGGWTNGTGTGFELPEGTHVNVKVRQIDAAGNIGNSSDLGTVVVDKSPPPALNNTGLVVDSGSSATDNISNDGRIQATDLENGAILQYQIDGGAWSTATGNGFELPEGTYTDVKVRQMDAAGNIGTPSDLGTIVIDKMPPANLVGTLIDSGAADNLTNDNSIELDELELGATVQIRTLENPEWQTVTLVNGEIILDDGSYTDIEIRQLDVAGNPSGATPINLTGTVTINTELPPTLDLTFIDSGRANDDGITNRADVVVNAPVPNTVYQYSIDNGQTWLPLTRTMTGFTLAEGEYPDLQVRQVDAIGNASIPTERKDIIIDLTPPSLLAGTLVDTGVADGITSANTIKLENIEPNSIIEYRIDTSQPWIPISADNTGTITLPAGVYPNLEIHQVDLAGNNSLPLTIGPVTINLDILPALTARLFQDTGVSTSDQITKNGLITVENAVSGAAVQYSIDGGANWVSVGLGITSFTLSDGDYPNMIVRQINNAGTTSPTTSLGTIQIDTASAPLTSMWADAASSTSNGRLTINGIEPGARVEYRLDETAPWQPLTIVNGGHIFPVGEYPTLEIRQIDVAGNESPAADVDARSIIAPTELLAYDDAITLNLGQITPTIKGPVTQRDTTILEIGNVANFEPEQIFVIGGASPGTLTVTVRQTALASVANGFAIEVYDSSDTLIGFAKTAASPLVGTVANLTVLGLLGDDGLTAEFTGLAAGTYKVRVVNDSSVINSIVQNLSLADLGQGDVLVGAENKAVILNALTVALNAQSNPATAVIVAAVDAVLTVADATPLTPILAGLSGILTRAGVTTGVDTIVDSISAALLSNIVSLFERTDIETTIYEYNYQNNQISGDIFADNGFGADATVSETTVTNIAFDGSNAAVSAGSPGELVGEYGTLTINADGTFTYVNNGSAVTAPVTDVFTYTVTDAGSTAKSATLTFTINPPAPLAIVDANDDNVALNLGNVTAETLAPVFTLNVEVLKLGPLTPTMPAFNTGAKITVADDRSGAVEIFVKQASLVAVADSFRLDVYNSAGQIVYSGATGANSLIAGAFGLSVLGLINDDTLVARVEGLAPGDYYAVVSNDSSALNDIIQDLQISDLGNGAVLGADNQQVIIDALNQALGGGPATATLLNTTVLPLLGTLNGLPLTQVLSALDATLRPLNGLLVSVDTLIDAVSDALLNDLIRVLERTDITTTLTEFDFGNETLIGNVISGAGGASADLTGVDGKVRLISNTTGDEKAILADAPTVINGKYGILSIQQDGSYSYKSFGDPTSIGQIETFTYKLVGAGSNNSATLNITIGGDPQTLTSDTAVATIEWANRVEENAVTGTYGHGALILPSTKDGIPFTVTSDTKYTGTINVFATANVLPVGSVYLETRVNGVWSKVAGSEKSLSSLINLLTPIASIDVGALNLSNGSYRVATTVGGLITTVNVVADLDRIFLNQYVSTDHTDATGNIFDNDILGSFHSTLQVKADHVGAYTNVGTDQTISGDFGVLTIKSDGSYSYAINPTISYNPAERVDAFDYRVTHPSGNTEVGRLTIEISPSGVGVAAASFRAFNVADLLDNYLGSEEEASDHSQASPDGGTDHHPLDYLAPNPLEDITNPSPF